MDFFLFNSGLTGSVLYQLSAFTFLTVTVVQRNRHSKVKTLITGMLDLHSVLETLFLGNRRYIRDVLNFEYLLCFIDEYYALLNREKLIAGDELFPHWRGTFRIVKVLQDPVCSTKNFGNGPVQGAHATCLSSYDRSLNAEVVLTGLVSSKKGIPVPSLMKEDETEKGQKFQVGCCSLSSSDSTHEPLHEAHKDVYELFSYLRVAMHRGNSCTRLANSSVFKNTIITA